MSKGMDPAERPPPYALYENSPSERTPLISKDTRRTIRRRPFCAFVSVLLFIVISGIIFARRNDPDPPIRVAIIGAGPAGIASAFTLQTLMKAKNVRINIAVFEEKPGVGGRMLLGRTSTGYIVHRPPLSMEEVATGNLLYNRILRERDAQWLKSGFGKDWKKGVRSSKVGLFDGKKIANTLTRPVGRTSWKDWLGRVFKYDASVWNARKLPTGTVHGFQRLLNLRGIYDGVGLMLAASNNGNPVAKTASDRLKANGISSKYVRDILESQVRRHTGQSITEMSDLALSMALDREAQGSQTSEIYGSLADVLKGFGVLSGADFKFNTRVSGMKKEQVSEEKEGWIIESSTRNREVDTSYELFDKVIIASPWNTSNFQMHGDTKHHEPIEYVSQWLLTVVSNSTMKGSLFGGRRSPPDQILPIHSSSLQQPFQDIEEITHVKEVVHVDHARQITYTEHLYRVVSKAKLDDTALVQLSDMFDGNSKIYQEEVPNAYPLLSARSEGFPEFKILQGLWHTSIVESIGSSVELSWVAGENVPRLVAKEISHEKK